MDNPSRRRHRPQAIRQEDPATKRRVRAIAGLLFAAATLVAVAASLPSGRILSSGPSSAPPAGGEPPSILGEAPPAVPVEPTPPPRSVPIPPVPAAAAPAAPEPTPTPSRPPATVPAPPTSQPTVRPTQSSPPPTSVPTATPAPTATTAPLASQLAPSPSPSPAPPDSPAAACRFGDSFGELARALGEPTVGQCLENEFLNLTTGDTHQRTSRGLLVWVKARGVPAFTDGGTTWYGCADAVRQRPSGQPFPC